MKYTNSLLSTGIIIFDLGRILFDDTSIHFHFFSFPGVSVFSNLLQYKQTIGQRSLRFPRDVLTTDKVVVLDLSPNCIHFFSRSGDLLTSCVSRGEDQGCLVWNPHFFCLDCEQNILVSDLEHHAIKILSNSGELLHTIGREGNGKGEFIEPYGIAISNSGILFVLSDNPNYCLQLF